MLIVFEGIDGSGKTTLSQLCARSLERKGREVVWTREPWQSSAAQELAALFARAERDSTPEQELELFMADRAEHVAAVVAPALARGALVVQDRTFYSTAAYQGARGLDVDEILERGRRIAPEPDRTFLLLIEPKKALDRIRANRPGLSSFERLESLRAVDRLYREIEARTPSMIALDAERPLEQLVREVELRVRASLDTE